MRIVKNVDASAIQSITPERSDRKMEMRESLRFIENAMHHSNRSLDSFKTERLSKYEAVN